MAMDVETFCRCLARCADVGAESGMRQSIVRLYDETLKADAEAFLAADAAVTKAEAEVQKKDVEASAALLAFYAPYREARRTVRAYEPSAALPDTLQAQPTDTDKVVAIKELRNVLADHGGETWADELAQGEIGQQAIVTETLLNAAITAGAVLAAARINRSNAYGPAYERFLMFKRLMRDALGSKSRQYRSVRARTVTAEGEVEKETEVQVELVAAPVAAPVDLAR